MIALLAGIAILMLVVSEIAVIAPKPRSRQVRAAWIGALALVLVVFGVMWLVQIRDLLIQTP